MTENPPSGVVAQPINPSVFVVCSIWHNLSVRPACRPLTENMWLVTPAGVGPAMAEVAQLRTFFGRRYQRAVRFPCLILFFLLMVSACKPASPYSDMSDDNLHTRATAFSLPDRYALYVDVLRSELPPRPVLASDVASMGEPAWTYTMARATGGSV